MPVGTALEPFGLFAYSLPLDCLWSTLVSPHPQPKTTSTLVSRKQTQRRI